MLSSLWTLAAVGDTPLPLADYGIEGASLSGAQQSAETLSLTLAPADAIAMADLWEWEDEVILYRDGAVFFRGYVATAPRSLDPDAESASIEIKNHWWLLERLTYRQSWTALTGSDLGPVATGRVSLARDEAIPTAAAMISELSDFCAAMGVTLTIDLDDLTDQALPLIEGHNRTVAELLRDILRWFPGAALVPVYGEGGTSYRVITAASAALSAITIGGEPLASLSVSALPEMQVDAVRVIYETTARLAEWEEDTEEVIGGFRASDALVAATDTYPIDATLTRRSLVITLPHPQLAAPPEPQVLRQPVATRAYPADGATDTAAQRWWLDRSGLGALGLTSADIVLPSTSTDTVLAHRVILDPSTPVEYPPSPVNPASTPVWSPDEVGDLPRELVAGALADWMGRRSAPLVAQVTIGISKTAVAGLDSIRKAAFMRMGPRSGTVGSTPAWLKDATYTFTGTNALTKTYTKVVSVDYDDVDSGERAAEATEASYTGAISAAVVPGLARRLYDELSPLRHQGRCSLEFAEIPSTQYLGRQILFTHPDRPEWGTMQARVQSVESDIGDGSVRIAFGPPEHLSPQDWVALHDAARKMRERRSASASAPQTQEGNEDALTGQIGTTITPVSNFTFPEASAAAPQMWDLVPIEGGGGTFQCHAPRIISPIRSTVSATSLEITGNSFTPASGNWVFVRMDFSGTAAIEMASTWTGHPNWYQWADDALVVARIPLWELVDADAPGAVAVSDGVWALRHVGTGPLRSLRTTSVVPGENILATAIDLF